MNYELIKVIIPVQFSSRWFLCTWKSLYHVYDLIKAIISVQFKVVFMCLEKRILCTPTHLSEVSPTLPLKLFQCSSD